MTSNNNPNHKITRRTLIGTSGAAALAACSPQEGGRDYNSLDQQARAVRQNLFQSYPSAKNIANLAAGHLVFPYVAKAGLVFGGSHGKGAMFVRENITGHYQVTGLSWGLQLGIQSFSMILFFMTAEALAQFRAGPGLEFGTDVEYALPGKGLSVGASTETYNRPVYTLVFNQSGLQAGISLEGAKYSVY